VVIFAANDGDSGIELWRSDGTAEGTRMFRDLLPGPASSNPDQLHSDGTRLFFIASTADGGAGYFSVPLDDVPPSLACPGDTVLRAGEPLTLPEAPADAQLTSNISAGTVLPAGTKTVVWVTATDDAGNTSTCTFD